MPRELLWFRHFHEQSSLLWPVSHRLRRGLCFIPLLLANLILLLMHYVNKLSLKSTVTANSIRASIIERARHFMGPQIWKSYRSSASCQTLRGTDSVWLCTYRLIWHNLGSKGINCMLRRWQSSSEISFIRKKAAVAADAAHPKITLFPQPLSWNPRPCRSRDN